VPIEEIGQETYSSTASILTGYASEEVMAVARRKIEARLIWTMMLLGGKVV
jgi:hypothetical protein